MSFFCRNHFVDGPVKHRTDMQASLERCIILMCWFICFVSDLKAGGVPTVHGIPGPYRFFFYSFDCYEPRHVHVRRERMVCKF